MKVRDRFDRLEGSAVFVVHDPPEVIEEVLLGEDLAGGDLPFPVLVDRDRDAYRRWGLARIPWWRLWLDPNVWRQYVTLLTSGMRIRGAGSDVLQLGGDFIVAPDGTIAYSRPQVRDDRPPVGRLAARMRELADADDR